MAIYLDSAIKQEVRDAMSWGFMAGVTTNPSLLAAAGDVSLDALKPLCQIVPGQVFYQLTTHSLHSMLLQAQAAFSISPSQVVLKIPCTLEGLRATARLSLEIPVAVTAVFSSSQAYIAKEAGARYVLPYVNRSTRILGDGIALVKEMASVLKADGRDGPQILAASLKSPSEAIAAIKAGAEHISVPFEVAKEMARHPLSEQAIQQFDLASG
jgi:transaldolase